MIERRETRYARAPDGVHIAYQAFGVGRYDILYVPGQISHLDLMWEDPEFARWMHALGQLGRVIMIDRRGVGLSDRLSPRDLPPVEVLAGDLDVVMHAAGATRPVLFGFAEGGQICSLYAAQHPDRVAGLIVYGMWTHVREVDRPEWERWMDWATERWGTAEAAIADSREIQPGRARDPWVVEFIGRVQRTALSPGALRPLFEVSLELDVREVLPAIAVPTLVMHRERDSAQAVELMASAAPLIVGARHVVLPGADHWITAEPQAPMLEAIATFLTDLGGDAPAPTRRLVTVLFTDVVGSTERSAELGDVEWKDLLERHHGAIRGALATHGGREISTAGDGFFAAFDGPAVATRCALEAVATVRNLGLEIRAGVHTGEVETIDGEIGGIAVAIGARVGALAGPSEILVSQTVKDLVAGSGLRFQDAGEHELKGVPDRWRLYRVVS